MCSKYRVHDIVIDMSNVMYVTEWMNK